MLMDLDPQSTLLCYSAPAIEIATLAKPLCGKIRFFSASVGRKMCLTLFTCFYVTKWEGDVPSTSIFLADLTG